MKSSESANSGWEVISWREFLKKEATVAGWTVEELFPWDGLSLLCGPPKSGKSSLARCLAATITGKRNKFLGREVQHGSVLHLSLEERAATMRTHYEKLQPDPDRLFVLSDPTDRPSEQIGWLENVLSEGWDISFVILDTVIRFLETSDTNDYALMIEQMDPLIRMARRYNVHIMLVHHSKKGQTSFGNETLGSTALPASVDTFAEIKVNSAGDRIFHAYGRDDVYMPDTPIYLHPDGWITDSDIPDTPADDLKADTHTPPLGGGVAVINFDKRRKA